MWSRVPMARLRVCREGIRWCGEAGRAKWAGVRRCASTHARMSSTYHAGRGRCAAVAAGLIAATAGALGASQATAACSSEGGSGSDAGGSEQGGDVPVTGMRRAMTSLTSLMRGGPPPEAMKGEVVLGEDGKPIVPWTYFASWLVFGAIFGTVLGFGLLRTRKRTEAELFVEYTVKLLERHPAVQRAVGTPLETASVFSGHFEYDSARGTFRITGPVLAGLKAKSVAATVHAEATSNPKAGDLEWRYQRLDVEVPRRTSSYIVSATGAGSQGSSRHDQS